MSDILNKKIIWIIALLTAMVVFINLFSNKISLIFLGFVKTLSPTFNSKISIIKFEIISYIFEFFLINFDISGFFKKNDVSVKNKKTYPLKSKIGNDFINFINFIF